MVHSRLREGVISGLLLLGGVTAYHVINSGLLGVYVNRVDLIDGYVVACMAPPGSPLRVESLLIKHDVDLADQGLGLLGTHSNHEIMPAHFGCAYYHLLFSTLI
jgi:hypothetical protein